mmetsp:Transcript_4455/g.12398  ORF Transcript_4455/g.12398 Transcript_4455/m.12398 type:complete len:205 (-) Transcript_4455:45-659(-)
MDGVDFEDLCLDPYNDSLEKGRAEGHAAGLKSGFEDGRSLGRIKGLEIGIELGYMRGVAIAINKRVMSPLEKETADTEGCGRAEKVRKVLKELINAIDSFPSPDEMFADTGDTSLLNGTDGGVTGTMTRKEAMQPTQERPDIAGKLQRIRAKFKLLLVQLKLPQLSLKKVMDEALHSGESKLAGKEGLSGGDEETISLQKVTEW